MHCVFVLHTIWRFRMCYWIAWEIANEVTVLHSLDPRNYLFNGQEEGDYLFGQGIMNEASSDDKEYLQLHESWCLFAYREFYKNLLAILDAVSLRTFGEKINIQNRFCKLFYLHGDEKVHAFLLKLSNNTHSDFGLSYQTVMNNQCYTIRWDNTTTSILTWKHTNNELYYW